jgi:hypothetical protein
MNRKRSVVGIAIVVVSLLSVLVVFEHLQWRSDISPNPSKSPPNAQPESVTVRGKLSNGHGGIVQNGNIIFRNPEYGSYSAEVQRSGNFEVKVPPGSYSVLVIGPGVEPQHKFVDVGPGSFLALDMGPSPSPSSHKASNTSVETETRYVRPTTLYWNAWFENGSDEIAFKPLKVVDTKGDYSLVVDLAAILYKAAEGFVFSKTARRALQEYLLNTPKDDETLKLLAIPDDDFFEPLEDKYRFQDFPINLAQIRNVFRSSLEVPRSPFEVLRRDPQKARFSFRRRSIRFTTKDREGLGAIAFAIWANDSMPIEEFSVPICVVHDPQRWKAKCGNTISRDPLEGFDAVRAAVQEGEYGTRPDVSLHFIELSNKKIIGLFRDNSRPAGEYVKWNLVVRSDRLSQELANILTNFEANQDDASLLDTGTELYNLLFPDATADAKEARLQFEGFIRSALGNAHGDDPRGSVFVRFLTGSSNPPYLIPLGLLTYSVDQQRDFLGYHFRIQAPLQVQNYEPAAQCVDNWVVFAPRGPTTPSELQDAVKRFSAWFDENLKSDNLTPYADLATFFAWLRGGNSEAPLALFILAHQDHDALWVTPSPRFGSNGIAHTFKAPTLAVVNACQTAAPGSSEIVEKLNTHGVTTIIATSALVDRYLAGDFFATLGSVIREKQGDAGYPISSAYFDTIERPRATASSNPDSRQAPYGAKALAYEILGNGNLSLCFPRDHHSPSSRAVPIPSTVGQSYNRENN